MTIEMAADCVKACNNAGDEDHLNTPIHLFEFFVRHFGWDCKTQQGVRQTVTFASMCGFDMAILPEAENVEDWKQG